MMRFPVSLALMSSSSLAVSSSSPRTKTRMEEEWNKMSRLGRPCAMGEGNRSLERGMVCHGARMTERPGDCGVTDFVALGKAGMEGGKLDWKSQGWQNRTSKSFGMVTSQCLKRAD